MVGIVRLLVRVGKLKYLNRYLRTTQQEAFEISQVRMLLADGVHVTLTLMICSQQYS
jgi:hypothetical protein